MNSRFVSLFVILMVGVLLLSACATAEENLPAATDQPTSAPAEDETSPTPYPSSEEIYLPVTGSDPAYPAPEQPAFPVTPYPDSDVNPYPGVDQPVTVDPDQVVPFRDLAPQPGDKDLVDGNAFVTGVDLIQKEGDPIAYELVLTGSLPTPCHQLRVVVSEPITDGQIALRVYSVTDPNVMCIQVISPFQTNIPLDELPAGEYQVLVNNEQVSTLNVP